MVGQISPHGDTYWKKERGECGGLHLHILSPLPPVAVPVRADLHYCGPLSDEKGGVRGMFAYLSKPPPAELCRPGRLTAWTRDPYTRARRHRAALDEYAAARRAALVDGRQRLRPMSGWTSQTRIHTRPLPPLLVLALLRMCVLALLAAPIESGPLSVPLSTAPRPLPVAPVRSWRHVPTHPPPRIGQAQAR